MNQFEIVIPCFNEEKNLPRLIQQLETVVSVSEISFVLVDNGSTDSSAEIFRKVVNQKIRVIKLDVNQGYGGGIQAGLRQCKCQFVGWMHSDLQTPPTVLLDELFQVGPNTFIKGQRTGRRFLERLFTVGMAVTESLIFRKRLWDINGQPTIFPLDWFEKLESPPKDFSLDLFLYVQARKTGMKIVRPRVEFGERFAGSSSWNNGIRSQLRFMKRTIQYSVELWRKLE
jgi:glycosyltransferase involved in cell wall biosynthesis